MFSFKKIKIPHTFTIVFSIVIVCAVMTWFIPGGEFQREEVQVGTSVRQVVVADSYHVVENNPQTWEVFTAFFKGFERTPQIIVFILIVGGAFWIINETKSINVGIFNFLKKIQTLQKKRFLRKISLNNIIIALIIILFSFFGAVFGMSEECIAFMVIFVPLSISMGYDAIVGMLMCYVATHVGFAGAMLNPFTLGIAQGLSGLPAFSGLEYRFLCWLLLTGITIVFTLCYASKVHKHPQKSPTYQIDEYWRNKAVQDYTVSIRKSTFATYLVYLAILSIFIFLTFAYTQTSITIGETTQTLTLFPIIAVLYLVLGFWTLRKSQHAFILNLLFFAIITLVIGVLGYHWYIMEIAALFLGLGIASAIAYGIQMDQISKLFLSGCQDIMNAALIVGLAGGIIIILEDGKIMDTILYSVSRLMEESSKTMAIGAMYTIQTLLNVIIPSGSAKAALTIPMMAEFSDMLHISRQITVLAFQFGDGFTNMITPTSGVLIGCLGVARIPYSKWIKFIIPFILGLIILGFILLIISSKISLQGF